MTVILKEHLAIEFIKELDEVLEFLVISPDAKNGILYEKIENHFKPKISTGNFLIYIEKLVKDKLVYSAPADLPLKGTTQKLSITYEGVIKYLGHGYEGEIKTIKDKDDLDNSIKRITIKQSKFQRVVTYASLTIAIITTFIPLIIFWTDDKKMQIESKDLQEIQQTQKALQQSVQEIRKNLQKTDTLAKN